MKNKKLQAIIKTKGIKKLQNQKIDFKTKFIFSHAIQEFPESMKKSENATT